jgi:hypothetical protein
MNPTRHLKVLIVVLTLLPLCAAHADWREWLGKLMGGSGAGGPAAGTVAALTQDEIGRALKEALTKAVQQAVASLGKDGGYLDNLKVRIPMPQQLQNVEKGLRLIKQDKMADDFVATMNRAAERAVPEGGKVLAGAISQMTLDDARNILKGPDDAATQFFRRTSEGQLTERFLPIVKKATDEVGVTANYKKLTSKAGFLSNYINKDVLDIDGYVTRKSLDGLFVVMAEEEKRIRENPAARTTQLLQKVFGAKPQ